MKNTFKAVWTKIEQKYQGRNAFWREFIRKSLDEIETLDYVNTNEEKWITFKSQVKN